MTRETLTPQHATKIRVETVNGERGTVLRYGWHPDYDGHVQGALVRFDDDAEYWYSCDRLYVIEPTDPDTMTERQYIEWEEASEAGDARPFANADVVAYAVTRFHEHNEEIPEGAALAIASWYQAPADHGATFAAFASGARFEYADIVEAVDCELAEWQRKDRDSSNELAELQALRQYAYARVTVYAAGWNVPPYSPDPDNVTMFGTFRDAMAHLVDQTERFWDQDAEIEGLVHPLDADAKWLPVHTDLHNTSREYATEYSVYNGDQSLALWVVPVTDDDSRDDALTDMFGTDQS